MFNVGHHIRVMVAGTGMPFYAPNPDTDEPLTLDPPAKVVSARNAVNHDEALPSQLAAPVRSAP